MKNFIKNIKAIFRRFEGTLRLGWKNVLLAGFIAVYGLAVGSCGAVKPLPHYETIVNLKDSTIFHVDTTYFEIPKEVYKDYTGLLDTLKLETSVAEATAYVDTTAMLLKGEIENKPIQLEKEVIWKEHIVYRDSIQIKEVPVEVEVIREVVPKFAWWSLALNILTILGIAFRIFIKIKFNK